MVAHGLPLFHVHGLILGVLGPLRLGGGAWHLGRFSSEAAAAALVGARDDALRRADDVPPARRGPRGVARRSLRPSAPRGCSSRGSAALPARDHSRISAACGLLPVERYGMSETLMNTAIRADGDRRPGTVGVPLDGVSVRLVDDSGGRAGRVRRLDGRRDPGPRAEPLPRVPQPAGRHRRRRCASRRLVRDRRRRDPFRRRLHPDRRAARDRPDQERRLQDRGGGDRERAARASRPSPRRRSPASPTTTSASGSSPGWWSRTVRRDPASASSPITSRRCSRPTSGPRVVRYLDALPRNAMGKVTKATLGS